MTDSLGELGRVLRCPFCRQVLKADGKGEALPNTHDCPRWKTAPELSRWKPKCEHCGSGIVAESDRYRCLDKGCLNG